jgi:hypothetical protein
LALHNFLTFNEIFHAQCPRMFQSIRIPNLPAECNHPVSLTATAPVHISCCCQIVVRCELRTKR